MKTGNRRPRIRTSKAPNKGAKNYLKQGLKAIKKAVSLASGPTNRKVNWNNPVAARHRWLAGFTGGTNAHQGGQEKARRVRQMAEHKCINPECWT